jgi:hypothetical protein
MRLFVLPVALSFAAALFVAPHAQASLDACGNIDVRAEAKCTAYVEGGCQAACEKLEFEATCHAHGYLDCRGRCSASVEAACTASCEIDECTAKCEAKPAVFECQANCVASCDGSCVGSCESQCGSDASCKSQCQGSCKASCRGECSASCKVSPPSATCEAKCRASCQGQCKVNANAGCQARCQGNFQAGCESELKGGCDVQCQKPSGVLACDGQYVDYQNNAEECLDALTAWTASIEASGTAECSGNQCSAEGEASCECGTARGSSTFGNVSALLGAVALGVGASLRRRRRLSA